MSWPVGNEFSRFHTVAPFIPISRNYYDDADFSRLLRAATSLPRIYGDSRETSPGYRISFFSPSLLLNTYVRFRKENQNPSTSFNPTHYLNRDFRVLGRIVPWTRHLGLIPRLLSLLRENITAAIVNICNLLIASIKIFRYPM